MFGVGFTRKPLEKGKINLLWLSRTCSKIAAKNHFRLKVKFIHGKYMAQIFTGLDEQLANNMIENCIGTIGLPVGLGLNFVINGESLIIPMVIEEPSVVGRYLNIIVYKTLIDF